MKKLLRLELKRFSLKPHFIGLLIANSLILMLSIFMSTLLNAMGDVMTAAGLPGITLTTVSIAAMLVRAALIVWQGVLIAKLIIEEYQNKTISLLYTYPVSRKKLLFAKLLLICMLMLIFHIASYIFQHIMVYLASTKIGFVSYKPENTGMQLFIILSTILIGLVPLMVGMINKSVIATVVSSIAIVAVASNSQGTTAGLLSVPVFALILGMTGLLTAVITVRKMMVRDL